MGLTQQIGASGENHAAEFLKFKGFEVIFRNWRAGRYEIDIVAKDRRCLVFVEVKSRTRQRDTLFPEDKINTGKQKKLFAAAQLYLEKFPHEGPVRFDVVSVISLPFSRRLYYHPDAFFPIGC
jgi:putative endonuclease